MNRDRIEGHWKQMKGRARKASGRWSDSEREAAERANAQVRAQELGRARGRVAARDPRDAVTVLRLDGCAGPLPARGLWRSP